MYQLVWANLQRSPFCLKADANFFTFQNSEMQFVGSIILNGEVPHDVLKRSADSNRIKRHPQIPRTDGNPIQYVSVIKMELKSAATVEVHPSRRRNDSFCIVCAAQ